MKKFKCNNCGYCCSNFGLGKTLPVFSWEKEKLLLEASKNNLKIEFIPENVYYDSISKRIFFVNYGMKNMPCPFLVNNKCSIYKNRPLICRAFPIGKNPMYEKKKINSLKPYWFIHCENYSSKEFIEKTNNSKIDLDEKIKKYIQIFGSDSWTASFKIEEIKNLIESKIKKLIKLDRIHIEELEWMNYKTHEIMEIFDFLEKINALTNSEKKEILKKFKN